MYRRFTYLKRNIIIKLYKVTTYQSISRLRDKSLYIIYVIRKIKKKITRVVISRKNKILNLIFINISNSLLKSLINNIIFLEIINNYFRKY